MGNLVDHFIIKLKPEVNEQDFSGLLSKLPKDYCGLFEYIWKNGHFQHLVFIMDRMRCSAAYGGYVCYSLSEEYLRKNPDCKIRFSARYREESLLQVLRRTFYDTLLITENSFNWDKENQFTVVEGEVISEEEWMTQLSEDQQFRDGVITNLVKDLSFDSVIIP